MGCCDEKTVAEVYVNALSNILDDEDDNCLQASFREILNINETSTNYGRQHRIVISDYENEDSISEEADVDNIADVSGLRDHTPTLMYFLAE